MSEKKPTINDVAREAGVSKRTVSRVINGSTNVGAKTLEIIQAVIKRLDYSPDKQARGLASSRSYLLGLIYDNPDALYIDQVQRGVLDICSKKGYELVVHPCKYHSADLVQNCLNFIRRSSIDGVIVLPPVSESKDLAAALREAGLCYVRMASVDLDDHTNIVVSDERAAMSEMARYMHSLGHRDIGFITGPLHYYSSIERLEGFRDSLAQLTLALNDELVIEGENSYQSGIDCAKTLLQHPRRPTAIFANNDEMAAGVLKAAVQLGIKVPEELSIAGFDDNLLASRIIPSLTTIQRPVGAMASLAAHKIIQSIEKVKNQGPESDFLVKPHLIIRESTSAVKA
ncbi:MAG: LacI family DNA-binding transcriptional regulator [Paraglaciecola sp.]|uniref:LacI family DNA-binding transcriptional regulator n=1 Tax=Paraglaciecola sp. TaxID=1920173 RepID=UPI00273FC576|nr:LacI family DNA-binding transcriptional regulator [Paraglaciecola sp.]MDP5029020.1 LacI family DNA-binding transcriptional regulator [Paraglaciecola sp.]MDP5129235.1 LacI family DNA-binding transcriptional regulator [Paraglaciecola sp.]